MNDIIQNYVTTMTKNYANFQGRVRRRDYWWFMLVYYAISTLLFIVIMTVTIALGLDPNTGEPAPIAMFLLFLLSFYAVAHYIPSLALCARRLHDIGQSGWLQAIGFIPLGGLVLLFFCVQDSQEGSNNWGENPKRNRVGAGQDW